MITEILLVIWWRLFDLLG